MEDHQKCQYTYLGNSGLRVSNICLSTMTFGESLIGAPGQLSEEASHQIINRFVEWGGNFLDTANHYGRGASETVVGSWLAGQERDRYVIATKVRFQMDSSDVNAMGLSRRHIVQSVEDSLKRLKTDYIDLLQTHAWDDAVPLEETLRALEDLVRGGKVRYLGASNVAGWQMQKIVDATKHMGFNPFISLQQQYSLVSRHSEWEPFQVCKLNGVGVLPWSPLKGGFLTGKVKKDQIPTGSSTSKSSISNASTSCLFLEWSAHDETTKKQAYLNLATLDRPQNWAILDSVKNIAETTGKSMTQVSLRWLLQKSVVSAVVIGATKMQQLDDNLGAANGWTLTAEQMKELDEVSRPDIPYPYEMLPRSNATRTNPWNPSPYV
ncbi:hypothetical protein ACOMHN_044597 [Nucella lapillus]